MTQIKNGCDAVMKVSTGGGMGMSREERLRAAVTTSPEMASLNVGSLNFGIFPMAEKYAEWKHPWEIEPPFFGQLVFGVLGGVGADLGNL